MNVCVLTLRRWPTATWTTSGLVTTGCPASVYLSTAATSWSRWWTLVCWIIWPKKTCAVSWRWWTASTGQSWAAPHVCLDQTKTLTTVWLPEVYNKSYKPSTCGLFNVKMHLMSMHKPEYSIQTGNDVYYGTPRGKKYLIYEPLLICRTLKSLINVRLLSTFTLEIGVHTEPTLLQSITSSHP